MIQEEGHLIYPLLKEERELDEKRLGRKINPSVLERKCKTIYELRRQRRLRVISSSEEEEEDD
jgi:ribosomal protein L36